MPEFLEKFVVEIVFPDTSFKLKSILLCSLRFNWILIDSFAGFGYSLTSSSG